MICMRRRKKKLRQTTSVRDLFLPRNIYSSIHVYFVPVLVIYQWNFWFETGDDRKTATDTRGASAWEPDVRLGSYDHIIFYRVGHSRVCIQYYFCCHEQIPCFIFLSMVYLKNVLASINQIRPHQRNVFIPRIIR